MALIWVEQEQIPGFAENLHVSHMLQVHILVLFLACGAALAAALWFTAPFPKPLAKTKEHYNEPNKGPELLLLRAANSRSPLANALFSWVTCSISCIIWAISCLSCALHTAACTCVSVSTWPAFSCGYWVMPTTDRARKITWVKSCRRCILHPPMAQLHAQELPAGGPPEEMTRTGFPQCR